MEQNFDFENAKTMLKHLAEAAKKSRQKEGAVQKLEEQVQKLKKGAKDRITKKDVIELEKRLSQVVQTEDTILRKQRLKEMINRRLAERIADLEKKLTAYIESKIKREEKLKALEKDVIKRAEIERQQIKIIEEQLLALERMYSKISSERQYSRMQLVRVKSKISSLKTRLDRVR